MLSERCRTCVIVWRPWKERSKLRIVRVPIAIAPVSLKVVVGVTTRASIAPAIVIALKTDPGS